MGDVQFDSDTARASALLDTYREWIDKYRGGLPAGWMASIMLHESGGNFNSPGDPSLGEVGYYQIAAYVPPLFGLDADARNDPESNVAIAALEYMLEAVQWAMAVPQVKLGTPDSYKLARLTFAVGNAGGKQLAQLASNALGGLTDGDVYHDIVRYVQKTGGVGLGSSSAAKVAARVLDIDRQWAIGQAVEGGVPGPPTRIPDPPAGHYEIPPEVAPYFVEPLSGTFFLVAGGLALVAYLLWKRR